jgi:hypothetical protein
MSIRWRRALPAFTLLIALLVTPTLAQARPSRPEGPAASSSVLGSLWHLLTSFWGAEGGSIDPWGGGGRPSSGGSIDPWGGHAQPANGARSSGRLHSLWGAEGASIDPWGGHAPAPTGGSSPSPSGGSIDPNG